MPRPYPTKRAVQLHHPLFVSLYFIRVPPRLRYDVQKRPWSLPVMCWTSPYISRLSAKRYTHWWCIFWNLRVRLESLFPSCEVSGSGLYPIHATVFMSLLPFPVEAPSLPELFEQRKKISASLPLGATDIFHFSFPLFTPASLLNVLAKKCNVGIFGRRIFVISEDFTWRSCLRLFLLLLFFPFPERPSR